MSAKLVSKSSTSVIVASVGSDLANLSQADFSAYAQRYPKSKREVTKSASRLLEVLSGGFDLVHLLCRISQKGLIIDDETSDVGCSRILQQSCAHGTKLLFFAFENSKEGYINGCRLSGSKTNIIMTLDRRGEAFSPFLFGLIGSLAEGESMVQAWVKAAPPIARLSKTELPSCIFVAGLPNASFLP